MDKMWFISFIYKKKQRSRIIEQLTQGLQLMRVEGKEPLLLQQDWADCDSTCFPECSSMARHPAHSTMGRCPGDPRQTQP